VLSFKTRGRGLVGGSVDPANAEAAIGNLIANSDMASISFLLAPIGLILFLYGLRVLVGNLSGGNGEALGRYGVLFFLLALVGWITGSARCSCRLPVGMQVRPLGRCTWCRSP